MQVTFTALILLMVSACIEQVTDPQTEVKTLPKINQVKPNISLDKIEPSSSYYCTYKIDGDSVKAWLWGGYYKLEIDTGHSYDFNVHRNGWNYIWKAGGDKGLKDNVGERNGTDPVDSIQVIEDLRQNADNFKCWPQNMAPEIFDEPENIIFSDVTNVMEKMDAGDELTRSDLCVFCKLTPKYDTETLKECNIACEKVAQESKDAKLDAFGKIPIAT